MESLTEKYLKLLSEYENLQKRVNNPVPLLQTQTSSLVNVECDQRLHNCSTSYFDLYERKQLLITEITKLYKMWFPPRINSFFSTIIPWIKEGFKLSKFAERRLEICKKCDLFTERSICQACGCYMVGKVKVPQARCPIGKWKADKTK